MDDQHLIRRILRIIKWRISRRLRHFSGISASAAAHRRAIGITAALLVLIIVISRSGILKGGSDMKEKCLSQASELALVYDYDGAIQLLQEYKDQKDEDIAAAIASYMSQKSYCTTVDLDRVPHIFFHSLVNDSRAFEGAQAIERGRVSSNNSAMATADEFLHVMQGMYDSGFVLISLDDLVIKNEDGTLSPNDTVRLPAGKKAFLMSQDDLSYYHSYGENGAQGYADRLLLDDEGNVKCRYTDPEGNTLIGDYDLVPLFETFIGTHPGFVYHQARPTIALTGFNGVLGYITNDYYKDGPDSDRLDKDQAEWLRAHPEYDYEKDCEEARAVAEAMKAKGWTFASHTYGHLDAGRSSLEVLQADQERWKTCVGSIVGDTDKLIFAFGADIGNADKYAPENEKYAYYKSEGYKIYCNCDGNYGWMQMTDQYVRTGRMAIDGFTLYQAMTPGAGSHDRWAGNYARLGVEDIAAFFDPARPTPIDSE